MGGGEILKKRMKGASAFVRTLGANISSILFYSLTTVTKPTVARKKLVKFSDMISGFHRDTDSFFLYQKITLRSHAILR